MIGHLRIKSAWSQLGLALGLLGGGFILTSIVGASILLGRGVPLADISALDWSQPHILSTMKLLQAVSSVTIFLVPAVVFALIVFTGKRSYFLGLKPPVRSQMFVLAMIAIIVAFPFVGWLGDLNQRIPLPDCMLKMEKDAARQMTLFLKAGNAVGVMINVFIIAFLPAVCEELFFRGMLQRVVINLARDAWTGIIITAVIFSAAHFEFQGFLPRTALGIVLGMLYWYSGSLWTSILAHFVNNAVQVVLVSYAPQYIEKNPSMPVLLTLVSAIALIGVLWVYRSFSTITYEKVYKPDELNRVNEFIA